jgi:hypothetical protein
VVEVPVSFPGPQNRTFICGSTGTGKTFVGIWLLSTRDYDRRVWLVFNFKNDALINDLGLPEHDIRKNPPKKPGCYVVNYMPGEDEDAIEDLFLKIWRQGNIGVYIDEGAELNRFSKGFRRILTQGRSLNIETIVLSQRPAWIDRYIMSESEYYGILRLNTILDRDTIRKETGIPVNYTLPPYHWLWYDARANTATLMAPVPDRKAIIDAFKPKSPNKAKAL